MGASDYDIKTNIDNGNLYKKPNIKCELAEIVDYEYISTYIDCYNIKDGTLNVDFELKGETGDYTFYTYFKDGSYIKLISSETWTPTLPTGSLLTSLTVDVSMGIMDSQEVINEYHVNNFNIPMYGLGRKEIYEYGYFNLSYQHWEIVDSVEFIAGDKFSYCLCWWQISTPPLRDIIMCKSAGGTVYNYEIWLNNLNPNILESGAIGVPALSNEIRNFLAGDQSEGTKYPGDSSDTGGGTGYFYGPNDVIDIPDFPSVQAIDFGFNSIYNPSVADLKAICRWLWSDDFSENIKMNYISPFDNILTLAIVPINVEATLSNFVIGNTDSNIQTQKVTNQYIELDCGSINVNEYWGSFLDYDATYTIYLPFIGYRSLKPDDMVDGELGVIYHIDLLTGTAVCFIWALKEGIKHVLYTYNCTVFYNVAISGANYMSMYNQQLAATTSGINNFVQSMTGAIGNALTGNVLGAVGNLTGMLTGQSQAQRQYETAKPEYGRGGNNGGNSGMFAIRYPYLIKSQPIGQTPANYKELQGIPAQIYYTLSELSGYTEVETVVADTLNTCTFDEKQEIINILKGGVIL